MIFGTEESFMNPDEDEDTEDQEDKLQTTSQSTKNIIEEVHNLFQMPI